MPNDHLFKYIAIRSQFYTYFNKSLCFLVLLVSINSIDVCAQEPEAKYGFSFQSNYYFLTDANGNIRESIDPFTYAEPFSEGLALVEKNLAFGYIDTTGALVVDYQYYDAGSFNNGLAYASFGDKYGYINKEGEFVIEPKFDRICDFYGEFARVLIRNPDVEKYGATRWVEGLINKDGELVSNRYFSWITFKEEGNIEGVVGDSLFILSAEGGFSFLEKELQSEKSNGGELPMFNGGEYALSRYIHTQTRYPISALLNEIKGRCYFKFVVDENGNVTDVMPAHKAPPILLKEGMRLVKSMPQWIPGKSNGRSLRVSYTIPINFDIN